MSPTARTPVRTRASALAPDYVLRVTIRDTSPAIWRRLAVPSSFTFEQLHKTLQFVFGWLNYHLYEFEVGDRRFESPENDEAAGEGYVRNSVYFEPGPARLSTSAQG